MNLAKIAVISALPIALTGCQAMIWGQLTAVAASALVFAGTLALGRATDVAGGKNERATRSTHD